MVFKDRRAAGKLLAQKLLEYRAKDAVILALPRGGVIPAYEIAKALGLPLDIIAARKIGHPNSSEYAIGAVDENGTILMNKQEAAAVDARWLNEETKRQKEEAMRRARVYRDGRKPVELAGKVVIIVDDGIATGLTMRLAVMVAQMKRPKKIIVAVPVAPPEAVAELERMGAEVILLERPEEFLGAVGSHYLEFAQVNDVEVIRLLKS